ncbi:hypothetical protein IW143_005117, partial [Coemansia sp. RSA 520]
MADKQNSQQAPKMCRNNCNFYGNPLYSDYCSKCFNELKGKFLPVNRHYLQQATQPDETGYMPPGGVLYSRGQCQEQRLSSTQQMAAICGRGASYCLAREAGHGLEFPANDVCCRQFHICRSCLIVAAQIQANHPLSATATASPVIQIQKTPVIAMPSSAESPVAVSCTAAAADCVQEPTVVSMSPAPSVLAVPAGMEPCTLPPAICEKTSNSLPTSSMQSPLAQIAAAATGASTPTKRVFNKKSRCAECKSRVPLAKQAINQCRCSYFFCDKHRYPEQHECEFDFMTCDRLNLEKNNPKLNSRPKGGL